jgi:hypothetical protein
MSQIKALGCFILFGILCRSSVADELAVSLPAAIETPALTQSTPRWQLEPGVGASGADAVFVWNKPAGDGTTNLFLTRLTDSGRPLEAPPRLVVPEFYNSWYPELYPAENGFFLRYFDKTNRNSPTRLVATRIDADGNPAFAAVVITTNIFKQADTASNGRSLLLLFEDYHSSGITLDYTILGSNGGIISTGILQEASAGHSFAAGSDGKDLLAVWSARVEPYLRVTRFSQTDRSLSTTGFGTNMMTVQTIGHGQNGYLVGGQRP